MSRSMPAEQSEPSPYNHHLQQFLTFLKQERGFAEATIVNRKRSLKPFLAWLLAQGVPLSGVSPAAITKYFTSAVAGRWKRTSISFHVQSLRSFFRYAGSRGWSAMGIAESIDAPRLYTYENLPQGFRISDAKLERLADLRKIKGFPIQFGQGTWTGLGPGDVPLLSRDISTEEIYAFDLQLP